jgi:hypothetical protein
MNNSATRKCPVKKPKQISITLLQADIEPDYFTKLGIDDKLCHIGIQVSVAVKLSDIKNLLTNKYITQKELKQIISKII